MRLGPLACCAAVIAGCGLDLAGTPQGVDPAVDGSIGGADAAGSDAAIDDAPAGDDSLGGNDAGITDVVGGDSVVVAARKKSITIDGNKVSAVLADFPMWIDLTDLQVAARAQASGRDLFFTASDGTPLAYEIQRWDRATGHLTAWVRVPQLSNVAATTIFLRYGEPTGAPAPSPPAVFSAGFVAVWHLEDTLNSAAIADATGTHAGTGVGLAATQQVAARLGGGIDFTGAADEITFTNPLAGSGPHTISAWVSQRTTSDDDALVVLGNPACSQSRWLHSRFAGPTLAVGLYCGANDWANPGIDIQNAGWTLLHWVFEGTNNMSRIYKNGVLAAGPHDHGSNTATQGTGGHLANAPSGWGPNMGAHATLDEVRIANVPRYPSWIAAEFANQSSPATFYAVGVEQLAP